MTKNGGASERDRWTTATRATGGSRPRPRRKPARRRWRLALPLLGFLLVAFSVAVGLDQLRVPVDGTATAAAAPEDRGLKLTVPRMERVRDLPVFDAAAADESALRGGALHVKDTGFPWQEEANVYIAGHRLGYPRTRSFLVFWDLNKLRRGDGVVLEDSGGTRYVYRVFDRLVVPPDRVSATEPMEGRNIVSLQTCTLPDYRERLIVRAELARTVEPTEGRGPRAEKS
ncbi:class E sortase [Rubrobacter tropicus]|nr:class E sortase [Rubrobacter tropicus]